MGIEGSMPCISADGRKRYRCEGEKRKRGYEMALGPLESIISLQHQNTQSMHPLLLASSYRSPPPASPHHPPLQLILPLILHPLYPHQLSLENYKSYELAKSSTTPPLPISFPVPFPPYHSLPTHPQPPPSTSHPIKTPIPKRERERGRQHTQRRTRRNRSHGPLAISQLRRDRQLPLVADAHIKEALVPSVSASAPWHLPSSPSHPLPSPLPLSLSPPLPPHLPLPTLPSYSPSTPHTQKSGQTNPLITIPFPTSNANGCPRS